jgi:spore coat protein CotH
MKNLRYLAFAILLTLVLGSVPSPSTAQDEPARKSSAGQSKGEQKPGDEPKTEKHKEDTSIPFFQNGVIPRLQIDISPEEYKKLHDANREYVKCTVTEDQRVRYTNVGVHLKGAAGSFRSLDDRPALTLNFDKFVDKQHFHSLTKIHLNNSVQDPGYLNELISSETFLAAGIATARTTHARVWLNGRDLGFYVLKEGYNKNFLKRHFPDAKGNLYDGGFVQDIDGNPKLMTGDGPKDRSDIKAVVAACREPDPAKRWVRMAELIDIDKFVTFAALEHMLCHWDGYCRNRNNYRFYFEPKSKKLYFIPHGMDQMFGDVGFSVANPSGALVDTAVMANPEWRAKYNTRLGELMYLFAPDRLTERIARHHQRMRPYLADLGEDAVNEFDRKTKEFIDRVVQRRENLAKQIAGLPMGSIVVSRPPATIPFSPDGVAIPTRWQEYADTKDAVMQMNGPAGIPGMRTLFIGTGPNGRCIASWRAKVMLPKGKYRFEARARTGNVIPIPGAVPIGAGIRVSGQGRTNHLNATTGWTNLSHEFEVTAPAQEVELIAELRAAGGRVTFDTASMRIVKVTDPAK